MKYLNRKLKSIMLSGLLSMGIVTANYAMFNKEVVLIVDGQEIEVNSYQPDVQGVLDENKIEYDSKYDKVFKSLLGSTIIMDNMDNAIEFSRVTGYLSLDERFGPGKCQERADRITHTENHEKVYNL